jgi:hypothetical protein
MAYEETATVEIAITWEGSPLAYRFDKPLRLESNRLKVASFSSTVSSAGSGTEEITTKVFRYSLSPTGSGLATIEPVSIEYVTWPDSIAGELLTDPMTVSIAEPIPTVSSGSGGISTGIVVALAGLALAAVGLTIYAVRRRQPREVVKTPGQQFLDDLSALRIEAGNDLKKFQTGLYRNLVVFISARYGLELSGKTNEDIISELEQSDAAPAVKEAISTWLTRAEKEKFSPVVAAPGEAVRLESEVREFFAKMHNKI